MEVQQHGNLYEDIVITLLTGMSKLTLDNSYTSTWDIPPGISGELPVSIKSTGCESVACSDILRMVSHNNYKLVVGKYKQVGKEKHFYKQYTFTITPKDMKRLWGDINIDTITPFVEFVRNIPAGREAQQATKQQRDIMKSQLQLSGGIFTINPKVDSKKQRRVQCSVTLSNLIASGVEYTIEDINYSISSSQRVFN